MNLSTIEQGEELLAGVTPGEWQKNGYHITSGEYKAFTSCRSRTDAEFICWARNHASELLQMAREVERLTKQVNYLGECVDRMYADRNAKIGSFKDWLNEENP